MSDKTKFGSTIKGHFCYGCLPHVDKAPISKDNPEKTDWCVCCEHRAAGKDSTAEIGNWLILGPTSAA